MRSAIWLRYFIHIIRGFFLFLSLACRASEFPSQVSSAPLTVDVFSQLSRSLAQSLVSEIALRSSDSCGIAFVSRDPESRFIENAFAVEIKQHSAFVALNREAASLNVDFEIQPTTTQVQYKNVSDGGLFTGRQVERLVTLELSARVTRKSEDQPLFAGSKHGEYRDTIDIGDVHQVESSSVGLSRAPLPPGGFFDRVVEPIVILISSGVLVFLLFTVRS